MDILLTIVTVVALRTSVWVPTAPSFTRNLNVARYRSVWSVVVDCLPTASTSSSPRVPLFVVGSLNVVEYVCWINSNRSGSYRIRTFHAFSSKVPLWATRVASKVSPTKSEPRTIDNFIPACSRSGCTGTARSVTFPMRALATSSSAYLRRMVGRMMCSVSPKSVIGNS